MEDILSKYRLKGPSADLKCRVALATKAVWADDGGRIIRLKRNLWQAVAGLAAGIVVAVAGDGLNAYVTVLPDELALSVPLRDPETVCEGMPVLNVMSRHLLVNVRPLGDTSCLLMLWGKLESEMEKGG